MFAGFTELTELPPLSRFCVAMLILFAIPPLCRRVRLPAVVGLMAAGVLVGPFGLQLAPKHGEVADFFSELGKLLLMFFAGMEIDLAQFNRTRNRSVGFGLRWFVASHGSFMTTEPGGTDQNTSPARACAERQTSASIPVR